VSDSAPHQLVGLHCPVCRAAAYPNRHRFLLWRKGHRLRTLPEVPFRPRLRKQALLSGEYSSADPEAGPSRPQDCGRCRATTYGKSTSSGFDTRPQSKPSESNCRGDSGGRSVGEEQELAHPPHKVRLMRVKRQILIAKESGIADEHLRQLVVRARHISNPRISGSV